MRPQHLGRLSIPTSLGYKLIDLQDIEYLESDDQLTRIYMEDRQMITGTRNIGYFEDQLKGFSFERVHNRVIVNLANIKEYSKQEGVLVLNSGKKVSISREKGKNVLKFLRQTLEENERDDDAGTVASLVVNEGDPEQQVFSLKKGKYLIGRKSISKPCDIMIETDDKSMSRNHFFMEARENIKGFYEFAIFIKEPLNKTSVDNVEMTAGREYPLKDKSLIRAGETDILFVITPGIGIDQDRTIPFARK